MSIAVLLACYDHRYGQIPRKRLKVAIPYIETATYADPVQKNDDPFELYSMWIRGEWEVAETREAAADHAGTDLLVLKLDTDSGVEP